MQDRYPANRPVRKWSYLLLAIPFIALLWVPFYSSSSPEIAGVPFFYWYQFVWVIISGILTAIVYFATGGGDSPREAEPTKGVRRIRRG